jgi:uncharacterized protein
MIRNGLVLALAAGAILVSPGAWAQNHPEWCDEQPSLNVAERTICRHRELWVLDDNLNVAYQNAFRRVGGQRSELQHSQRDWVRVARNGCGPDVECLVAVYERRINVLEEIARRGYV